MSIDLIKEKLHLHKKTLNILNEVIQLNADKGDLVLSHLWVIYGKWNLRYSMYYDEQKFY